MTIKSPARSALRLPYVAVRLPLGLVDEQVVVRVFGVDSPAHRSLLRGLRTLDALAASAFATGDDVPDDVIVDVEGERGEQPLEPEEQQEIAQLADTFLAEDELAPRSGELAENDELRRVQAEIRAKQAVETDHGQL